MESHQPLRWRRRRGTGLDRSGTLQMARVQAQIFVCETLWNAQKVREMGGGWRGQCEPDIHADADRARARDMYMQTQTRTQTETLSPPPPPLSLFAVCVCDIGGMSKYEIGGEAEAEREK